MGFFFAPFPLTAGTVQRGNACSAVCRNGQASVLRGNGKQEGYGSSDRRGTVYGEAICLAVDQPDPLIGIVKPDVVAFLCPGGIQTVPDFLQTLRGHANPVVFHLDFHVVPFPGNVDGDQGSVGFMLDAVVNTVFQERLQDQLHDRDVQQVIRAVEVNINLPSAVDVLDAQIRMSNLKQLRRFSFLLDSE